MLFRKLLDENISITDGDQDVSERSFVLSLVNDFEDGSWRHKSFHRFIWDNIALTALSKRERDALSGNVHSTLAMAAKNLRLTDKSADIGAGSELAEAILYGVMSAHFKALPVVPKIFYKQNSQDNAKGADSVHITTEGADFSIWFGEAKFYNSIEDARLPAIIASVENALSTDKLKKENAIICNVRDLDDLVLDEELKGRIKASLESTASIDVIKPRLHVPILLLHSCDKTKKATIWDEQYEQVLVEHHRDRAISYLQKQLKALGSKVHKYDSITFHVIIMPVPDKAQVVDKFLSAVDFYKGQ